MTGTVLLTGATGFVGRQVLAALIEQSASVRLVLREGSQVDIRFADKVESIVVTPDMFAESHAWWNSACRGIDTIIHVAWYAEPGEYLQSPQNLACLAGTLELAKACVHAGVRRFVGVGTCFEYELSSGYLSTDTPLNPITLYAATKASAFLTLSNYLPEAGVDFAWCRLFYLYGEGEDKRRLVPYLRQKLAQGEIVELTSGTQIRDFMDVQDVGRMLGEIAMSDRSGPINICSAKGITVRALAEKVADEYGRRDLLYFGARQENLVDPPCVVGIRENPES